MAGGKDVPGRASEVAGPLRNPPNSGKGAARRVEHRYVADGKTPIIRCIRRHAWDNQPAQGVAQDGVETKGTEKKVPSEPVVALEGAPGAKPYRARTPVSGEPVILHRENGFALRVCQGDRCRHRDQETHR